VAILKTRENMSINGMNWSFYEIVIDYSCKNTATLILVRFQINKLSNNGCHG